jgi:hypothetical protein
MLRRSPILLFLCIFVLPVQANESLFTYDQFQDGLDIRSVEAHDQSRIWSTCAVVHELVAMMDDNGPDSASAKQSANQGNGAKLASGIVFIVDYFEETDAPDPAAFVNKWEMAKLVMEENHKTTTTSILSVMAADPVAFSEKLLPTYGYCINILDVQQDYIDLWRELFGSGLLAPQK